MRGCVGEVIVEVLTFELPLGRHCRVEAPQLHSELSLKF